MKPDIANIRSLAERLSLSPSTVSRALRNHPSVRPDTRARVLAEAEKAKYQPNPLVNVLMSQVRSKGVSGYRGTLAYLETGEEYEDLYRYKAFQQYYEGAKKRALQLGYKLERYWLREASQSPERLRQILRSRGIPGLLIPHLPPWSQSGQIDLNFNIEGFACTTIGVRLSNPPLHCATVDWFCHVKRCCEALQSAGYKRIGLFNDVYVDGIYERRISSGYLGFHHRFQSGSPPMIFQQDIKIRERNHAKEYRRWHKINQPDALVTLGAFSLECLQSVGLEPMRDIPVAMIARNAEDRHLAGMIRPGEKVGEAAVDLVVGQLTRNENSIPLTQKVVMVEGVWDEGNPPLARAHKPRRSLLS